MRNPFLELLTPEDTDVPGTFWATVTGTDPLRVQRDGESVLAITPTTLALLKVGDRVLCLLERRQVVVLGRLGGQPEPPQPAYPAPNRITIGGVTYAASGTITPPAITWEGTAQGWNYATIAVPTPYTPPGGWTFLWSVAQAQRFVIVHNGDRYPSGGIQTVRVLQYNNSLETGLQALKWQLVAG